MCIGKTARTIIIIIITTEANVHCRRFGLPSLGVHVNQQSISIRRQAANLKLVRVGQDIASQRIDGAIANKCDHQIEHLCVQHNDMLRANCG